MIATNCNGPDLHFALNVSKTTTRWPSTDSTAFQTLRASVPISIVQEAVLVILSAPVGSTEFRRTTLAQKLQGRRRTHSQRSRKPEYTFNSTG